MALSDDQLTALCDRLDISPSGRNKIQRIRSSPPSRLVKGGQSNVCVRYPSRKMGVTIQAESHTNELAYVYEMEHDPRVLEYFDQPERIPLNYKSKNGRACGFLHTVDYFVIEVDGVGLIECKPEEQLLQLAIDQPNRYVWGPDGWRCPPGERYAEKHGFFYRVRSSSDIDPTRIRNIVYLEDYLRDDEWSVDSANSNSINSIRALVKDHPGITLYDLKAEVGKDNIHEIFHLMVAGYIYVDLSAAPLAAADQVRIYQDADTAKAYRSVIETLTTPKFRPMFVPALLPGQVLDWDAQSWQVVNAGESKITLSVEQGTIAELTRDQMMDLLQTGRIKIISQLESIGLSETASRLLRSASPKHIKEAHKRLSYIKFRTENITPRTPLEAPSERTYRRWLANYREAQEIHSCGFVGLLPRYTGNRHLKLPESSHTFMAEYIQKEYETLKQKSKATVYTQFVKACEEKGIDVPSYQTFVQAIKSRPRYEQTKQRAGKRAAYKHKPFVWRLSLDTPPHGDRPFEVCHLDHTELDIELVCPMTGENLGRPWLTLLMCAYSRRILAVYLTYDSPSNRSCMMVLRECVRRHQRLPQIIVVDGGPEFRSVYFEQLMAVFEIMKKTRPSGEPRFGAVIERVFGTTNTTFVYNLAGNTQAMKNVRQVTKKVNPKGQAVWTLERLYERLREWAYEIYDTQIHTTLGQSPREVFTVGMVESGKRNSRLILYNEDFELLTLPSPKRSTGKIQPSRGIKINHIYYWDDTMRAVGVEGTTVPIRYDPWDMGIAYAQITYQGEPRWIRCLSQYYTIFAGRSENEIRIATDELRARGKRSGKRQEISAQEKAEFLSSTEAEEGKLRTERQRAQGIRAVNQKINRASPDTISSPSSSLLLVEEDDLTTIEPVDEPAPTSKERKVYGDFY